MKFSGLMELQHATLNQPRCDAVCSSHIFDGEMEKSLIMTCYNTIDLENVDKWKGDVQLAVENLNPSPILSNS